MHLKFSEIFPITLYCTKSKVMKCMLNITYQSLPLHFPPLSTIENKNSGFSPLESGGQGRSWSSTTLQPPLWDGLECYAGLTVYRKPASWKNSFSSALWVFIKSSYVLDLKSKSQQIPKNSCHMDHVLWPERSTKNWLQINIENLICLEISNTHLNLL